jgi:uncharacterized protein (DUF2336 family)
MGLLQSFIEDVETAMESGDANQRTDVLRKVADMFVSDAPKFSEAHVGVFDEVIMRLSQELEFKARVDLAEKFAGVSNAPRRVMRKLAMDEDVKVAGPILSQSTRLDEEDILAVAKERGQDHLLAISERRGLSERITDILVNRGNTEVVRSVASNTTARFSDYGFATLTQKAQSDPRLYTILDKRADMPAHLMEAILEVAKQQAKAQLMDEEGTSLAMIDEALNDTIAHIAANHTSLAFIEDDVVVKARVMMAAKGEPLHERLVVDFLNQGKLPEAAATIADMAKVPMGMVAKAYSARHYDAILMIIRAARLSWPTFKLILELKTGKGLTDMVLKKAFESYERLTPKTAERVLRFMSVRNQTG